MSTFPITKTPTLASYVSVLRTMGAPVDAGLRRARLPTLFEEIPDAWIAYERLRNFTADMAAREGIPELGLIPSASDLDRGLCKAFRDPVLSAPTLFRAIQAIPSLTSRQTTNIRFWLEPAGTQVRACLLLSLPPEVPGYVVGETRTLGQIQNIIREYVGQDFVPTRLLLASRARDLHFKPERAYGGVPVRTDQPYGAIEFPRALLSTPTVSAGACPASSGALKPGEAPPATFSATLEACLGLYLCETYPDINLAAEIAGCSVRTMQRRLGEEAVTYGEIVDRIRCRAALSLLRDTELGLSEIALRLGYSEHSAFTRAFRRWTGASPNTYRANSAQTFTASQRPG